MDKLLFRQEALDALTQKMEGEVLLRQPFRYRVLAWSAIVLVSLFALTLNWLRVDQRFSVTGKVSLVEAADTPASVLLWVPVHQLSWLQPGQVLNVQLGAATSASRLNLPVRIVEIEAGVRAPAVEGGEGLREPWVQVHARLSDATPLFQGRPVTLANDLPVSAEVPAGRISIYQYVTGGGAQAPTP